MPELPEVEVARRNLERWLSRSKITVAELAPSLFHGGGTIGPPPVDMSMAIVKKPKSGCSVASDGDWRPPLVLLLAVAALYFRRRRVD